MLVCQTCAKYGSHVKKLEEKQIIISRAERTAAPQPEESFVADFPSRIRQKREESKQTHEEFAARLGIKTSILHKIETGHFTPDMETTRHMEKILRIKLIEPESFEAKKNASAGKEGMTIGDFIKINKK